MTSRALERPRRRESFFNWSCDNECAYSVPRRASVSTQRATPTNRESPFDENEIIVSKTDPRGRITYANDVFARVSQYSIAELLGAPHSIVRHPEMPRCVFKLLWDTIESKQEIFAYATGRLEQIPALRLIGTASHKASVLSFVLAGVHPHDVGTILENKSSADAFEAAAELVAVPRLE